MPSCTGKAVTATSAMPAYRTTTVAMPLPTTRLSARREILTSPARPAADSRPVKEIAAIVSAKIRSDHFGALPRWIGASSVCGSKNSTSPSTTMKPCNARSAITSSPMRRARRPPRPRMLPSTTSAMIASDRPSASPLSPSGLQNTRRYCVAE